jgi:stearoyl-CoA desaturase (delta-9 desaturase)
MTPNAAAAAFEVTAEPEILPPPLEKARAGGTLRQDDKIDWVTSIPFFAMHVAAAVGLFYFPVTWQGIAWVVGMYYLRMWAITTGYHRYFSHRTFKTSRAFQFFMALMGTLSVQKGVLWWAANHRHHHRYSDKPEDTHSPRQHGVLWAHVGWILGSKFEATKLDQIRDFTKYPELMWLNKHFLVPVVALGLAMAALGGWDVFFWGFVVSTVVLWHGTFTVNSLTHLWGRRRFATTDDSRNSMAIALITMGEGWHNNHHHYMNCARQGFRWWEIDASYAILRGLQRLGIVWDVREPPEHVRLA